MDDELLLDPLFLGLKLMVKRMGWTTPVDVEVLEATQPLQMVECLEAKVEVGHYQMLCGLWSKVGILPDASVLPREEMTAWTPLAGDGISQFL